MKALVSVLLIFTLCACQTTQVNDNRSDVEVSKAGFAQQRLDRIEPAMQAYIDSGKLSGILTLVARNGEIVHLAAQGMQDTEAAKPLTADNIFRIYSMTKPITAVAAMTLWEQGKFHMHDPITQYLPELKGMKVYVSGSGDDIVLEDMQAPIRIIDLFLHTSGFSYGFTNSEVDKAYQKMQAGAPNMKQGELLESIAKLPLNHQPGSQWNYGISTDIIGFLVERLSGKKLGEYMQETIFGPLDMKDTGFSVAPDKAKRLVQIYTVNQQGKTVVMENEPLGDYLTDPEIHNGGGGLVSTAKDYLIFAQMLLNGGEYQGVRILGRKTVEFMTSNQLPQSLMPFNQESTGEGYALAMSVTVDPGQSRFMSSAGNYGWGGMASTFFRIDPKEKIIMVSMAQFIPMGFHRYHHDFRNLVYQSLVD